MSERETHDFMSVDSFSQLPFIRPSPATERPSNSSAAIRLFGIEVPHEPDAQQDSSKDNTAAADSNSGTNTNIGGAADRTGESGRKFECHYCCRNFPTSQALGGHQNAHKRERQQAKRAHLQSAMVAHHHHHQSAAAIAGGSHQYGLLNYQRLGSVAPARYSYEPSLPSHYPSWNSTSSYGGLGSVSQPINGSPLPGLWRVAPAPMHGAPSVAVMHRDRAMTLSLFGGDGSRVLATNLSSSSSSSSTSSSPSPNNRIIIASTPPTVKDSVSLDLHL